MTTSPGLDILSTISPSKAELWTRCQYQWYRRYILGERKPPSGAAAFGTGCDKGSNAYYTEKLNKAEPSEAHTRELWVDSFEQAAKDVEDWRDEKPEDLALEAAKSALVWRSQVATRIEPLMVQKEFDIRIGEGTEHAFRSNGIIDLVASVPIDSGFASAIAGADLKTSGKRWSPRQVLASMQAPAYVFAVRHGLHLNSALFQFHVLVRNKTPVIQIMERTIHEPEFNGYIKRLDLTRRQIANAIDTGVFLPNRQHHLCSRTWCGWWQPCQAEFGGEIPV